MSPTSGYTLNGVSADFFTVAGATSVTNSANSGEITAIFPATPRTISTSIIISVRRPITGETPLSSNISGPGYTGTVSWIGAPTTFAAATSYSATVTLTATSGYTLTGVRANSFRISGASVTNSADSGVIVAVFPPTDATISVAAIAGVTAPVTGATPVTTTTAGAGYTGTVSWSGSPTTFAAGTIYTATIILTEAIGYTFSGVRANFFTVTGATSVTNSANTGVIIAAFPATNASQSPSTKASQTITFTDPADITYGQSPAALSATSTSSLTVTFTTATPLVCNVSGTTLTINAGGTCTINANQPGNENYQAASPVVQSFNIPDPIAQSIPISVAAIAGVTAPVADATPVTTTTAGTGYTGTVTWSGSPSTFMSITVYQATITLTATSGYTLTGVPANFFTVAGATSVSNLANSGVITAAFPATGGGRARSLAITTEPQGCPSGSVLETQPVIRIVDSGGATVTSSSVNVVASISGGSGNLSGTTTVAAVSGVATFTNLGVSGIAGRVYYLRFTADGLGDVIATIVVTEGTATKVVLTRAPVGTQRANAFTTQPQITIRDASDNTVTFSTAVVTATLTAGYQGRLIGTNTATVVDGVATFNDLGIDGTGGGSYTITYSVDGLTVATSTTVLTGINCDGTSFACKINDIGPGGGKIFYVSSGTFTQIDATGSMCSTTCKYLEVAPDFQSQLQWTGLPYMPTLVGTTDGIGTGYSNTLKMVGQSQAASAAKNYAGNGLSDWYLPSYSELSQIAGFNSIFGGFLLGRAYWSSSEFNDTRARFYVFNSFGSTETKQSYYYVLAVRAF